MLNSVPLLLAPPLPQQRTAFSRARALQADQGLSPALRSTPFGVALSHWNQSLSCVCGKSKCETSVDFWTYKIVVKGTAQTTPPTSRNSELGNQRQPRCWYSGEVGLPELGDLAARPSFCPCRFHQSQSLQRFVVWSALKFPCLLRYSPGLETGDERVEVCQFEMHTWT